MTTRFKELFDRITCDPESDLWQGVYCLDKHHMVYDQTTEAIDEPVFNIIYPAIDGIKAALPICES